MGKFEDYTLTLSGKSYQDIKEDKKDCPAPIKANIGNSKASWYRKKVRTSTKEYDYLDDNGNPIPEKVKNILSNR